MLRSCKAKSLCINKNFKEAGQLAVLKLILLNTKSNFFAIVFLHKEIFTIREKTNFLMTRK